MTYGSAIDVSDHIAIDGIDSISESIDSTDYDIGIFTFGDIQLRGINEDGYFNIPDDYRSIFRYSRDLCKVEVQFENTDGDLIVFNGLINDEATDIDATAMTINFKVLSRDSVIRTTNVATNTVTNGMTTTAAFGVILDTAAITAVLTYDVANVNPASEIIIDDGTVFDNMPTRDALLNLLVATNSVMLIDGSGNIIIRDRSPSVLTDTIHELYGPYDIKGRENIVTLQAYNTGKQRMFNAVNVNGIEAQNLPLIETFGYRKKDLTFTWITDDAKSLAIAEELLSEFSAPKIEFEVVVPSYVAKSNGLLDLFSVNYPLRVRPYPGSFLPIVGITKIGSTNEVLPQVHGSFSIDPNLGFKLIEKTEDPTSFLTTLKLRQIGTTLSDGNLNVPESAVIDFGVVGFSVIASGTDDTWNPSATGAARIGDTRVA